MLIQLSLPGHRYKVSSIFGCTFLNINTTLERSYPPTQSLLGNIRAYHWIQRNNSRPRLAIPLQNGELDPRSRSLTPLTQRRGTKLQALLAEAGLTEMDSYAFPDYRLKRKMDDPNKTPLLLVACGSFSPITFLHLRMFVMAGDYVKHNTDFELIGGYLSPVSDAYKKQGLATAEHR